MNALTQCFSLTDMFKSKELHNEDVTFLINIKCCSHSDGFSMKYHYIMHSLMRWNYIKLTARTCIRVSLVNILEMKKFVFSNMLHISICAFCDVNMFSICVRGFLHAAQRQIGNLI